jgi:hypothetical protein
MFHSVGHHVNKTASELRKLCAEEIVRRADDDFNGMKLGDWIKYEMHFTVPAYVRAVQSHLWGGALELKLLADYFRRPVLVFTNGRGLTQITDILPDSDCSIEGPIRLLFSGNHYDAIE